MEDENNLEELQKLVEFLKANGIAEYESERGDAKVRIKFASAAVPVAAGIDAGQLAQLLASGVAHSAHGRSETEDERVQHSHSKPHTAHPAFVVR